MSSPNQAISDVSDLKAIAHAYFDALRDGNLAGVPWADDVVLRAPLATHALIGRRAVEGYLEPLAGKLGEIHIREIFINSNRDAMAVEALVGPLHVLDRFVIREGRIVEQQNFYDPRPLLDAPVPGGLTADERALLIQMLERSRDRLRSLLESASDEALLRKPEDGGWSAMECAEHLVLTEEALLQLIRRQVLASDANPLLATELQGKDGAVVTAMGDRSSKIKTLDFLVPPGKLVNRSAVLDAFLARRAATLDFVRATKDSVHHHGLPMGALGMLDAYQWLLLMAAHTDRHLSQMRETGL